jgi:Fur family iron response transcriptional regulator
MVPDKTVAAMNNASPPNNTTFPPRSRQEIAGLLREHGVMPTHQRLEIAQVMLAREQHLSADQVLALVNAVDAETSKATVYNTLKLFVEKRLVRELIVDPSKVFYDSNTGEHHHFYDVVSGRLTDIPAECIRLQGLPTPPEGMVTDGVDVIIRTRPAPAGG